MSQPHIVKLEWYEIATAAQVGILKRIEQLKKAGAHTDMYGISNQEDIWTREIEGAAAEMAWAKWKGVYWDGSANIFNKADVGNIHVRSSYRNLKMRIKPSDPNDGIFVFIFCRSPFYEIHGYTKAGDAKLEEWYHDGKTAPKGPPFFWVPVDGLKPVPESARKGFVKPAESPAAQGSTA
jgi:hypothetical protein